ncbi:MAG: ABZJ_00895 family protein, partial [Paracoccaceae bacterium]
IYTLWLVGLTIIVIIIATLLVLFAGVDVSQSSAIGTITAIIAAMSAGQHYGTRAGKLPSGGHSWSVALGFIAVNIILGIALAYLGLVLAGEDAGAMFASLIADVRNGIGDTSVSTNMKAIILGGILVVFLVLWACFRFAFSSGAKQAIKRAEMLAAKGKP